MNLRLSLPETRVLGVLVEKERTVPDTYPLSLNALVAGCNQKNNRDPVLELSEAEVQSAVDVLKRSTLVIESSGARVARYAHNLGRVLKVPSQAQALLAVLMLRGPQTAGELRIGAERLHRFADISSVEAFLEELATRPHAQGGALVVKLPRRPGERESRWAHLLNGPVEAGESCLGESVFAPDACWSLRRGRSDRVPDARQHLVCAHMHQRPRGGYSCLPISAHGEANGVIHVQFEGLPEDDPLANEAQEEFLRTTTEHIALALANARLRENRRIQASRDALTGLVNRRYMEETFEREIRRCARKDKPIAVFMVDVDHFKRLNDTHGHEAGDSMLRHVAATLTEVVRFEDIVCRYGGEEFLLVLPEADEAAALERAERARARVERTVAHFREQALGGRSISIGVAMFPMHGERIDELIRAADAALYRAKAGGRNRVSLHGADAAYR